MPGIRSNIQSHFRSSVWTCCHENARTRALRYLCTGAVYPYLYMKQLYTPPCVSRCQPPKSCRTLSIYYSLINVHPSSARPCAYPWRCLCFGFSQITLMLPFLLIILHFSQIGFTDDLTFMSNPPSLLCYAYYISGHLGTPPQSWPSHSITLNATLSQP